METTDYRIYRPAVRSERGAHVGTVVATDAADAFRQCDEMYEAGSYILRAATTDEIVERP